MFLGSLHRYALILFLVLLKLSGFSQKIQENNKGKYFLKADTTYSDTIIGGRSLVVRNITIYDTVFIVEKESFRPFKLKLQKSISTPGKFGLSGTVTPLKRRLEYEAGIGFGVGVPFQPNVGYDDRVKAIESTNFFETFIHGSRYFGKWYLKCGVNLSQSEEKIKYTEKISMIDSSDLYTFSYDSVLVDTFYLLDLTQLPDSVYLTFIRRLPVLISDTLYKTSLLLQQKEHVNRYFRVGFPLLAGRIFNFGRIDFAVEGGLFTSFLVSVRGKAVDVENNIIKLRQNYLYRVTSDVALRLQFSYKFKSLKYVTLTPLVRYNFIDLYKTPELMRNKILSFRFAIGYNFY
jgi:hypothetical protein